MTPSDLIDLLKTHPKACAALGIIVDSNEPNHYSVRAEGNMVRMCTRTWSCCSVGLDGFRRWPSPVQARGLSMIVGPLVLWCWERRIEAIHADGTWQAYSMDDGNEALSDVHAEPWLALLQACEEHEETP